MLRHLALVSEAPAISLADITPVGAALQKQVAETSHLSGASGLRLIVSIA